MRDRHVLVSIAVVTMAFAIASCSRPKPVIAPEPPPAAPPAATEPAPPAGSVITPEPGITPAETPEGGIATGDLPADVEAINRAGYLKDIFFDTDKSDLRDDTRETLAANAAWLREHPTVKVLVEGHCDERNTDEYNLALGWRRANAVKDYLVSLGVAADRITTISYGEERPFAPGHDESAWWQNRRGHFVVTAR